MATPFQLNLSQNQFDSYQQSDARLNIWVGSVRSGKSFISLLRFLHFLQTGPAGNYIICGKSLGALEKNILELLGYFLGSSFQYFRGRQMLEVFGKKVYVVGANDARAEQKIRGSTFAGAYVDEITILPETFFVMLLSRLSVSGAKLFGTTNPDSPFHWLKKNYIDDTTGQSLKCFNFTLEDNPDLDADYKKNLKKEFKGLYYQRFIEGHWVLAEGAVFDFFDEQIHCIDHPPTNNAQYIVGVDYGTTNPTAFVLIGHSKSTYPNMWIEKEYYWDSRKENRQKTDTEYADDLLEFIDGYNVSDIYVDPSAVSFRVQIQRSGVHNVVEADNEVLDGIRYHIRLLADGTLKICRRCRHMLQEYQSYSWDANSARLGIDKPMKTNDHSMDAIRYALYTHFHPREGGDSMSAQDLQELRLKATGVTSFGGIFDGQII